jgi:hypothetical protein
MQIELVLIALLIGGLAIVIKLTGRLQRSWVERDLQRGDLRILSDTAFRRLHGPAFDSVQRLRKRGFLVKTARGPYRMTLTGWVAVFLRHTSARPGHQIQCHQWDSRSRHLTLDNARVAGPDVRHRCLVSCSLAPLFDR